MVQKEMLSETSLQNSLGSETVSEAPGAYGIRSCSHATQAAS